MTRVALVSLVLMTVGVNPALAESKTAFVAQQGGDFTSPVAAMSALATWCGAPSASNPCSVKIAPGVYDVGEAQLILHPHVDIEGSGENVTRIRGSNTEAVVKGAFASNMEIRFLTLESYGTGMAVWTLTDSPNGPTLSHATIISTGTGLLASFASSPGASAMLKDVNITTTGAGAAVYCQGGGVLSLQSVSVRAATAGAVGLFSDFGDGNLPCSTIVSRVTIASDAIALVLRGPTDIRDTYASGTSSQFDGASKVVNSQINGSLRVLGTATIHDVEINGTLTRGSAGKYVCSSVYDAALRAITCPR